MLHKKNCPDNTVFLKITDDPKYNRSKGLSFRNRLEAVSESSLLQTVQIFYIAGKWLSIEETVNKNVSH